MPSTGVGDAALETGAGSVTAKLITSDSASNIDSVAGRFRPFGPTEGWEVEVPEVGGTWKASFGTLDGSGREVDPTLHWCTRRDGITACAEVEMGAGCGVGSCN